MKSKLSAALAAAGCVLAVSPAVALTITYDHFATMSSVPGANVEVDCLRGSEIDHQINSGLKK